MASSFDYKALTEEEKQRILNGNGPPGGFSLEGPSKPRVGLNIAAVKSKNAANNVQDF
jgi:hypothetical protein